MAGYPLTVAVDGADVFYFRRHHLPHSQTSRPSSLSLCASFFFCSPMTLLTSSKHMRQPLRGIALLWGFIESDFVTFAVPNTAFGVFGALASSMLVLSSSSSSSSSSTDNVDSGEAVSVSSAHLSAAQILRRLPLVLAYNVANLIIFDLANQRTERSVAEDKLNKPWRPIPQGKITPEQTRRLMLAVIPFVLALNYLLGGWNQGLLITVLSWMYNDLGGGDEAFVREMVISVAYGLFNSGSLAVAVGPAYSVLSPLGLAWTVIVSGVILTTMQVQDLKDQAGDRLRGRKTICLYLGENFSRTSIAFFVGFWSCVCGYFWALGPLTFSLVALIAAVVAVRVLFVRSPSEDAKTWRLWCLWHASLYTLPVLIATDI